MKKPIFIFGFLVIAIFIYKFNAEIAKRNTLTSKIPTENNKIKVVASFYPMYFFASQIGGEKADVTNITPDGAEPHDYEPTTQENVKINQSNLLILNGANLELWGNKIKDQLQKNGTLVIVAGEGLTNKNLNENRQKILDPHIWLDPILAKKEVENIKLGFEKVDAKNGAYFETKAKILKEKLDELDKNYKNGLKNCQKKDFITSHEAFGYLAERYGINQIAISGISPDEEPTSQKLAKIVDLVKEKNIKIIFFESFVNPKLSEIIAEETGAKTMTLDPIEGITENNLEKGVNYFTLMKQNLDSLQTALQCNK